MASKGNEDLSSYDLNSLRLELEGKIGKIETKVDSNVKFTHFAWAVGGLASAALVVALAFCTIAVNVISAMNTRIDNLTTKIAVLEQTKVSK